MTRNRQLELVKQAVATHADFKSVAEDLERLAPDLEAVRWLINAYDRGEAPAWLTAVLLGRIGHDDGYATARAILLAAPGLLAEDYAGCALARLRGSRALDDLVQIMSKAPKIQTRKGAAAGLGRLNSEEAATAIVQATRDRVLPAFTAGGVLAHLPVSADVVAALLAAEDPRDIQVATELLYLRAWSSEAYPRWSAAEVSVLLPAVRRVLERKDVRMAPRKRKTLGDWCAAREDMHGDDGGVHN